MNYKNNILSYKSYYNCDRTIMCIINCITVIPTNCFFSWYIQIGDDYKICCQCSYSFCEVCTLCLVGLWVYIFTQKCNIFCVVSMLFMYHIFIVGQWEWDPVLLCTITITSYISYFVTSITKTNNNKWQ